MTNVAAGDPKSPAPKLFIPAGWKGEGQPPLYTAAQVAALTAAPNAKASIHALSQINAAQRELLDAMGAHTAQPAAPQGVAYAELPDDFPKTVAELEFLLDVARNCGQHMERADRLAASNGQAPAGAADEMAINRPVEDSALPFNQWRGEMQSALKRAGVYAARSPGAGNKLTLRWRATRDDVLPAPTAQAAPAADYDHGPQSLTVAEAARHVGKWLNERPNSPLDLRDVAMLVAHVQAPAAGAVAGSGWVSVPVEVLNLYHFMASAFVPVTGQHAEIDISLQRAKKAMLAAAPTPAAQADSVLEDAARWKWLTENCDGDDQDDFTNWLCATVADKASIDAKADEYIRHATRKQGGKHD